MQEHVDRFVDHDRGGLMIDKVFDRRQLRRVDRFTSCLELRQAIRHSSDRGIVSSMVVHHVPTGRREIAREPSSMDLVTPPGKGKKIKPR